MAFYLLHLCGLRDIGRGIKFNWESLRQTSQLLVMGELLCVGVGVKELSDSKYQDIFFNTALPKPVTRAES